MTTRLLMITLGVATLVHSADAQSVFLKNGENGSHFECAVVSNGYNTGGGIGFGYTKGAIDMGAEIALFGGLPPSSVAAGQVGSLDLRRLFNVKGPVAGPAVYLAGISPEGEVVAVGVGLIIAQPLTGSGGGMHGSDAGFAVGYRGRRTTVLLDISVAFMEAYTSYSVGLSVNFLQGNGKKFRSGERW